MKTRSTILLLAAFSGILTVVLDFIFITYFSLQNQDFDIVRQYISELTVEGAKGASFLSIWWVIYTPLLAFFAYGLNKGIKKARFGLIGPLTIAIEAVLMGVVIAFFPCREGCSGNNLSDIMHTIISAIGVFVTAFTPYFLYLRMKKDACWEKFSRFVLYFQIIFLIAIAFEVADETLIFFKIELGLSGLIERALAGIHDIGMCLLGLKLFSNNAGYK